MKKKNKILSITFAIGGILALCGTAVCGYFIHKFTQKKLAALKETVKIFKKLPSNVFDFPNFQQGLLNFRTANFQMETFIPNLVKKSIVLNNYPFSFLQPKNLNDVFDAFENGFSGYNIGGIYGEFVILKDDGGKSLLKARNLLLDFNDYAHDYLKKLIIDDLPCDTKQQILEFIEAQEQQPSFENLYKSAKNVSQYFIYATIGCAILTCLLFSIAISFYSPKSALIMASNPLTKIENITFVV